MKSNRRGFLRKAGIASILAPTLGIQSAESVAASDVDVGKTWQDSGEWHYGPFYGRSYYQARAMSEISLHVECVDVEKDYEKEYAIYTFDVVIAAGGKLTKEDYTGDKTTYGAAESFGLRFESDDAEEIQVSTLSRDLFAGRWPTEKEVEENALYVDLDNFTEDELGGELNRVIDNKGEEEAYALASLMFGGMSTVTGPLGIPFALASLGFGWRSISANSDGEEYLAAGLLPNQSPNEAYGIMQAERVEVQYPYDPDMSWGGFPYDLTITGFVRPDTTWMTSVPRKEELPLNITVYH